MVVKNTTYISFPAGEALDDKTRKPNACFFLRWCFQFRERKALMRKATA
jgi:hypothetical protein